MKKISRYLAVILVIILLLSGCTTKNTTNTKDISTEETQINTSIGETTQEETTQEETTQEETIQEETIQEETLAPLKEGYRYAWVSVMSRLNIRKKANKKSDIVGHIKYRQCVVIKGKKTKKGFYQITATDCDTNKEIKGYCLAKYLTFTQPSSAKVELDVPAYLQTDKRWAKVTLGNSGRTIKSIGCATTCLAMSESFLKQQKIYPDDMEKKLYYTSRGNLGWPKKYDFCYDSSIFMEVALEKLQKGIPVLIGSERRNGNPHWVLITGYTGDGINFKEKDFLINDPLPFKRTNLKQFRDEFPVFLKLVFYTGVDRVEETAKETTKASKKK